jgi:hypothetical protein
MDGRWMPRTELGSFVELPPKADVNKRRRCLIGQDTLRCLTEGGAAMRTELGSTAVSLMLEGRCTRLKERRWSSPAGLPSETDVNKRRRCWMETTMAPCLSHMRECGTTMALERWRNYDESADSLVGTPTWRLTERGVVMRVELGSVAVPLPLERRCTHLMDGRWMPQMKIDSSAELPPEIDVVKKKKKKVHCCILL